MVEDDPPTWLWMRITEHQARALIEGTIDEELVAMCRCMIDWQWDLAKNAAKPLNFQTTKKKNHARRRTKDDASSSRTASTSRGDSEVR
jgi:hypothetical protein